MTTDLPLLAAYALLNASRKEIWDASQEVVLPRLVNRFKIGPINWNELE